METTSFPIACAVVILAAAPACGPRLDTTGRVTRMAEAPPAAAAPSANPWSGMTREILVQACSPCHRGDLPTAVPRALQVFDLSRDAWWDGMAREQLDGLILRVRKEDKIPEWDRFTVDRFVRCARDRECETSSNSR